MAKKSLKTQMTLTISMIILLAVLLISILANVFINVKFRSYIANQQSEKTQELVSSLSQQYSSQSGWNVDFLHMLGMYALYDGFIIAVYDEEGGPVWDAENHDMSMCTQVMMDISERMQAKYPRMKGEFTSSSYPLEMNDQAIGSVIISYYGPYFLSENDFQFLDALNTILVTIGAVSLCLAIVVGRMMAGRIIRPLTKTVSMAKEISEGNYDIPFAETTNTKELDDLVTAINNLADSLSEQEELRRQLTADVAHELRTPLTSVSTHIEAMIEGIWQPTQERLESCYEEINRINSMVKDLESLAKVESDNLKLDKVMVDLKEIIKTVVANFETDIHNRSLKVDVNGTASMILADSSRMSQVFINLMSNAIKYTPGQGEIEITLRDNNDSVIVAFKDNGIGISAAELPYIFERFYRADKSRNRQTGGAGIGLAIVKSIVHAHGGTVEAESVVGKGSQFRVILPRKISGRD